MERKHWITMAMALSVAGCFSTKQPPAADVRDAPAERILLKNEPTTDTGAVVIVRDVGMLAGGCYLGVMVDGELAAKLDRAERVTLHLPAGEHVLTATYVGGRGLCGALQNDASSAAHRRSVEINISAGQVKRYRLLVPYEDYPVIEPAV